MRVGACRLAVKRGLQVGLIGKGARDAAPCATTTSTGNPLPVAAQVGGRRRRARGFDRGDRDSARQVNRDVSSRTGQGQHVGSEVPASRRDRLPVGGRIGRSGAIAKRGDLETAPANVSRGAVLAALVQTGVDAVGQVLVMHVVARCHDLDARLKVVRPDNGAGVNTIRPRVVTCAPH